MTMAMVIMRMTIYDDDDDDYDDNDDENEDHRISI